MYGSINSELIDNRVILSIVIPIGKCEKKDIFE
jgi:hypothetical protein